MNATAPEIRTIVGAILDARARRAWNAAVGKYSPAAVNIRLAPPLPENALAIIDGAVSATNDAGEIARLAALRTRVALLAMDRASAAHDARIRRYVTEGGEGEPIAGLRAKLAAEPDAAVRRAIFRKLVPAYREINPLLFERIAVRRAAARKAGYADAASLFAPLGRAIDETTKNGARAFLNATDADYKHALADAAAMQLGLPAGQVRRADIPFLLSGPTFAHDFARDVQFALLDRVLARIGASREGVRYEARTDTREPSAAACYAIDAPSYVRVAYVPADGPDATQALFHETGHALFARAMTADQAAGAPFAPAIATETAAFLLDGVVRHPAFVEWAGLLAGPPARDYERFMEFVRLYLPRRFAAKVLFAAAIAEETFDGVDALLETGRALFSRAYAVDLTHDEAAGGLFDIAPQLYDVAYWRAWRRAEVITGDASDNPWFTRPDAPEILRATNIRR
ncbi:hypothetical protein K8I61_19770 [bacterium]|nr:hypothetical protein [bacterium]